MNWWQASISADKISIFSLVSLTNLSLKLQFCMKKAAMKLSSLPLKMSVSYRNRTYNRVLGGPRYIHLTKETNAVFSSFFSLLATVAISMNPITKWWISIITYFDIQINPYWNRTLTYHFSTSVGVNHDWTLGGPRYIHLTKGTNAVFLGFSAFWTPAAMFMNPITCVMNCSCYYILILAFLQTLKSCCFSLNGLHLVAP